MLAAVFIILIILSIITATDGFRETPLLKRYQLLSEFRFKSQSNDSIQLQFRAFGDVFDMLLFRDEMIIHPNITITLDGQQVSSSLLLQQTGSPFVGSVVTMNGRQPLVNTPNWARIVFHNMSHGVSPSSFEGSFHVQGELYTVQTAGSYAVNRRDGDAAVSAKHDSSSKPVMIIYRESDRDRPFRNATNLLQSFAVGSSLESLLDTNTDDDELTCQAIPPDYSAQLNKQSHSLHKRAEAGCPAVTKIIYIGVAADCTYVSTYGGAERTLQQILNNFNQINNLFQQTFNIVLGIIEVDLQTNCDQSNGLKWNRACSLDYTISQRLNDFTQWRGTKSFEAGLWHLMTKCGTGSVLGISWLGTVCKQGISSSDTSVSGGTGVSSITTNEWILIAHEIGHNLGAKHDCNSRLCFLPDQICRPTTNSNNCQCFQCEGNCDCGGEFIMHPTNDAKSARFSLASQQAICRTLSPAILQSSSCLKDPGTRKTLSGNVCGNGIKEGSEECDCGPADSDSCSNDPCCNGSTCKLKAGAKCSDKNDLCCSGCKVKPAQTVCRPSIGMCDVEEKCNGSNGDCPPDAFIEDLTECTISGILLNGQQGQCAQGYCTSRTLQCQARSNEVGTYDGECRGFANNCELSCSVKGQQGRCDRIFGGFFVDGTACGYKGVCKSGACEQYGINALIGWIMANLGISITIFVVIFLMIIFCIHRCYKIFHVNRNIRQLNTSRSELIGSQPNLAASNASLRRAESAVSISRPQPALSRSSTVASNLFKSVNEGQVTPIMMKKASYPGQRSSTFAPMSASTAVPPPTAPQPTAQSTVSAPPPYGNTTDSSNTQKWVDPKLYNGNAELEGAKLDEFIKSTSKDSDINK